MILFKGVYQEAYFPAYTPAHGHLCGCSAAESRQFPSKPLRESQSRLLTSTPSWTESDNATIKDIKGETMGFSTAACLYNPPKINY